MLHAEETQPHADAVFLGEGEGRMAEVLADFRAGRLKPRYDYLAAPPPIASVVPVCGSIRARARHVQGRPHGGPVPRFARLPLRLLSLRGQLSRGADCLVPGPSIPFWKSWLAWPTTASSSSTLLGPGPPVGDRFLRLIPLKKKWCSHPIADDDQVLDLAAQAGAWYVYQAIFDTSDFIRRRIERYHAHGIGVEGTILLGLDDQSEDDIKRLVDFLLEVNLDLAEFTVLTPFPHTRARRELEEGGVCSARTGTATPRTTSSSSLGT